MPKNRVLHNLLGLSVGPAPSTGYTFISSQGTLNNDTSPSTTNYNLLYSLPRVISFNYGFDVEYYNYQSIGYLGNLNRQPLEQPTVNFSFTYNQIGIGNENKLGFYTNYRKYDDAFIGQPKYSNNSGVFLLSGFLDNQPEREYNQLGWPLTYRDRRNFFLSVGKTGFIDLNTTTFSRDIIDIIGFGNCYITNYSCEGSVGNSPKATVSYIGENVKFYDKGSGYQAPGLLPKSGTAVQGVNFFIPSPFEGGLVPSILKPGDITLSINEIASYTGISALNGTGYFNGDSTNLIRNFGPDFQNLFIQSYQVNIPLPRQALRALNYKLPIDRKLIFPILANISFNIIENDLITGSLNILKNRNADYNFALKINNNPLRSPETGTAFQLDVLRAKFTSSRLESQIGTNNIFSFNYDVELTPQNLNRGIFMSGLLNVPPLGRIDDYLQEENGNNLLTEDLDTIYATDIILY